MTPQERDPAFLIAQGYLERCVDLEHAGQPVLASRLGWRITARFVQTFCGRVLGNPSTVFEEEFLQPERQDLAVFADGVDNIVGAMRAAAAHYFEDGSVALAAPPLQALLHLMRDGHWEGRGPDDPQFRALFTREALLASDWYRARLEAKQTIDASLWADPGALSGEIPRPAPLCGRGRPARPDQPPGQGGRRPRGRRWLPPTGSGWSARSAPSRRSRPT